MANLLPLSSSSQISLFFHESSLPLQSSPLLLQTMKQQIQILLDHLIDLPPLLDDNGHSLNLPSMQLKELSLSIHPRVEKALAELNPLILNYAALNSHDVKFVEDVMDCCKLASRWILEFHSQQRENRFHLEGIVKSSELEHEIFKAGEEISVYQFLSQYEKYACEHLTTSSVAIQLIRKHLDPSIRKDFPEIEKMEGSYSDLKAWLIMRFGDVKTIIDAKIKKIEDVKLQLSSETPSSILYLCREVYNSLYRLVHLEVSPGKPVPKLLKYLSSDSIISKILELLPNSVRDSFLDLLADAGLGTSGDVEGFEHLQSLITHLEKTMRRLELKIALKSSNKSFAPTAAVHKEKLSSLKTGPKESAVSHNDVAGLDPHTMGEQVQSSGCGVSDRTQAPPYCLFNQL